MSMAEQVLLGWASEYTGKDVPLYLWDELKSTHGWAYSNGMRGDSRVETVVFPDNSALKWEHNEPHALVEFDSDTLTIRREFY